MRRTGPDPKTVRAVRERDNWECQHCGSRDQLETQHRKARGIGGTRDPAINLPSNLLTLCHSCHMQAEAHPLSALTYGYRVPQHTDPSTVPVASWALGLILLRDDGTLDLAESDPS